MSRPKPVALIILDGFGYSEKTEHNAIKAAHTPYWDNLWETMPKRLISGSGLDVGLPQGQMGNSEVGHLNLGAGRIVYQDFTRIAQAIEDKSFFSNSALSQALDAAIAEEKAVHILGLLSPGGVHSHEDQIMAAVEMAHLRGAKRIFLHAFLDGRDTPPKSATASLERFESRMRALGTGRVASITGRYYAMDRDKRWDRIEQAYKLLVDGEAQHSSTTPIDALNAAYARGESDEFVLPTRIDDDRLPWAPIADGDAVIFMNYRADRARELTQALALEDFTDFQRSHRPRTHLVTLTEYQKGLPVAVAFGPLHLPNVLGEVISRQGWKQLRIAETEKYAHVTFFFNGGVEEPFPGEDRCLIPSPKVATYDLQPEMNAPLLTDHLVQAIESKDYDLIVCNFANPDMVGHTGNFQAAVKAIETIDVCLKRIGDALFKVGGEAIITADHGNAEKMLDTTTGQAHTAHTSDPVPCVLMTKRKASITDARGILSDVAPTLLALMRVDIPEEMTGKPLFYVED